MSVIGVTLGAYPDYELPEQGYRGPPVVPVILPGGYIADTEEVARAKDLHFNAFAQAASAAKESGYEESKQGYSTAQHSYNAPQRRAYTQQPLEYIQQNTYATEPAYQRAYHQEHVGAPRRQENYNVPQYTAAARYDAAVHSEANPTTVYKQPSYPSQPRYTGPPVIPVILPNGYIAETADVEAAKEHHFQLFAKAQAAVARAEERAKKYGYSEPEEEQYQESHQTYTQTYVPTSAQLQQPYRDSHLTYGQTYQPAPAPRQQYKGPAAVPVVLPDGHIADTAEVAAAKINHLQTLLDAAQRSQQKHQPY